MKQLLRVHITSPEKILWEGEAQWVSSVNSQGAFDVLPYHANFITVIENQSIKIKTSGKVAEYTFPRAVLYNHNNKVSIYVNI